jgi:hypothetical protein
VQGVYPVDSFDLVVRFHWRSQTIGDVNAPDDQYVVFRLDLSCYFRCQSSVARVNLARLQRAPESTSQSTGGSSDDVINGCGVRLRYQLRIYAIVFGDGPVHPEADRLRFGWQVRQPQSADNALDTYSGLVDDS